MPILNYTTTISPHKTIAEIQVILARAGAGSVNVQYINKELEAVTFTVALNSLEIHYRLPCNWHGVQLALRTQKGVKTAWKTELHARRVAWRIIKDWIESQLALIESQQAELAQVFLPYAMNEEGETVYDDFKRQQLLLTSGE